MKTDPTCTNHFDDGSKIFPNRDCCKPATPLPELIERLKQAAKDSSFPSETPDRILIKRKDILTLIAALEEKERECERYKLRLAGNQVIMNGASATIEQMKGREGYIADCLYTLVEQCRRLPSEWYHRMDYVLNRSKDALEGLAPFSTKNAERIQLAIQMIEELPEYVIGNKKLIHIHDYLVEARNLASPTSTEEEG